MSRPELSDEQGESLEPGLIGAKTILAFKPFDRPDVAKPARRYGLRAARVRKRHNQGAPSGVAIGGESREAGEGGGGSAVGKNYAVKLHLDHSRA